MIFGPTRLADAQGAVLAHTLRLSGAGGSAGAVLKKGRVLSADDIQMLQEAGHTSVVTARLEAGDVAENVCADRIAEACLGPGVTRTQGATGRVNLHAERAGLLLVDALRVDRLNRVDESVTLATLAPFSLVAAREMVGTVKVIPFAVEGRIAAVATRVAAGESPLFEVRALRPLKAGLVMTRLAGLKESILAGAEASVRARLDQLGASLGAVETVAHTAEAVAASLRRLRAAGVELLLIAGASAVVDRRDVCPSGLVAAGGTISHFGMPVDPGNLLCLGELAGTPAVVLPGCARSPKLNGFDLVLQRLLAGVPLRPFEIMGMGVGGLLTEIATRPLPRAEASSVSAPRAPRRARRRVGAIVLAAGRSRRMAPRNKLLIAGADGRAMIARVVDNVLESRAEPVVVVTGHQAGEVEAALAGRHVLYAHNPAFADGLSSSLRTGLAALAPDTEGALVVLGDMPLVAGAMLDRLIDAFDPDEDRAIVLPTFNGKQGNPMLWARQFFPAMAALSGDVGARHLAAENAEATFAVEIGDDAVLRDFDTPETLPTLVG
ncbi:MAG: molybdopterin-binding/glycosyltransferase family 2 protein [Acetobacteraceae bacterium]|nr:molybdopterin-binding/glycosyltransferase family 2 protein [Acetobacteraceae bacterium]